MQIGELKTCRIHVGPGLARLKTGRVYYIHPQHRFYTVRFIGKGGPWSESFFFPSASPSSPFPYETPFFFPPTYKPVWQVLS